MITLSIDPGTVAGLGAEERVLLSELLQVYLANSSGNEKKRKYYEGKKKKCSDAWKRDVFLR